MAPAGTGAAAVVFHSATAAGFTSGIGSAAGTGVATGVATAALWAVGVAWELVLWVTDGAGATITGVGSATTTVSIGAEEQAVKAVKTPIAMIAGWSAHGAFQRAGGFIAAGTGRAFGCASIGGPSSSK